MVDTVFFDHCLSGRNAGTHNIKKIYSSPGLDTLICMTLGKSLIFLSGTFLFCKMMLIPVCMPHRVVVGIKCDLFYENV